MIHHLTWEAHSKNKDIVKYKIYEVIQGFPLLVAEVDSSTLEYLRRQMQETRKYVYRIVAQDNKGRMGPTAEVIIE